jgi:hypothetical protein
LVVEKEVAEKVVLVGMAVVFVVVVMGGVRAPGSLSHVSAS